MASKRNINYCSARDLNKSLLSEELFSRVPHLKIFINESLSPLEHTNFKSLAKGKLPKILVFGLYDIGASGSLFGGTLARLNIILVTHLI